MNELWNNAPMWHAINVHLPLMLAMVGLPLVAILAITRGRHRNFRWALFGFYVLLVLSALYAVHTGEQAMRALSSNISVAASKRVELHESMARAIWIFGSVTALFLLLVNIPRVWARQTFLVLALMASLATTGWVALTGHFGGTAVYHYGLGTPASEFESDATKTVVAKNTKKQKKSAPPTAIAKAAPAPAPVPKVVAPAANAVAPVPTSAPAAVAQNTVPSVTVVKAVSYEKDIKPILVARCVECHEGTDAKSAYEVSTVMLLKKNGKKAGPGIVPGDPDGSAIMQYVTGARRPQM